MSRNAAAGSRTGISPETAQLWASSDAATFMRSWLTADAEEHAHTRHTGNRLAEVVRPGLVVMAWTPGPQLANLSGVVHGGYLALVCDEAAGLAASSAGERFVPMLTLDLDVTYLRPAPIDVPFRIEGEVLHAGRTRTVSEARVLGLEGELVATTRGSFVANQRFARGLEGWNASASRTSG